MTGSIFIHDLADATNAVRFLASQRDYVKPINLPRNEGSEVSWLEIEIIKPELAFALGKILGGRMSPVNISAA
jgi:hypothetical protein